MPTILVIAVEILTVCDCGPEVNVPDIVHDDAVVELAAAANTLIVPPIVVEAVALLKLGVSKAVIV